jgi:dUTP pyrophosphatase
MDLRAAIEGEVILQPGDTAVITTGLRIAVPPGYEAQIRPRSGLAAKHGITIPNAPGTIDSDYRGVLQVILTNMGREPFAIRRGDRIAQMVIAPVTRAELRRVPKLDATERGEGGFGSSGRN